MTTLCLVPLEAPPNSSMAAVFNLVYQQCRRVLPHTLSSIYYFMLLDDGHSDWWVVPHCSFYLNLILIISHVEHLLMSTGHPCIVLRLFRNAIFFFSSFLDFFLSECILMWIFVKAHCERSKTFWSLCVSENVFILILGGYFYELLISQPKIVFAQNSCSHYFILLCLIMLLIGLDTNYI